jgi:hypothetical protein
MAHGLKKEFGGRRHDRRRFLHRRRMRSGEEADGTLRMVTAATVITKQQAPVWAHDQRAAHQQQGHAREQKRHAAEAGSPDS